MLPLPLSRGTTSVAVLALALSAPWAWGCRPAATAVVIELDTDVPAGRALTVAVTAVAGAAFADPSGAPDRVFRRGEGPDDVALPASFGVVPRPQGPRDGTITLVIEARIEAGGDGEPAVSFRR